VGAQVAQWRQRFFDAGVMAQRLYIHMGFR
jgi:hypothetical protein